MLPSKEVLAELQSAVFSLRVVAAYTPSHIVAFPFAWLPWHLARAFLKAR